MRARLKWVKATFVRATWPTALAVRSDLCVYKCAINEVG